MLQRVCLIASISNTLAAAWSQGISSSSPSTNETCNLQYMATAVQQDQLLLIGGVYGYSLNTFNRSRGCLIDHGTSAIENVRDVDLFKDVGMVGIGQYFAQLKNLLFTVNFYASSQGSFGALNLDTLQYQDSWDGTTFPYNGDCLISSPNSEYLILIGGYFDDKDVLNVTRNGLTTQFYCVAANRWHVSSFDLNERRKGGNCAIVDGTIYTFGGHQLHGAALSSIETSTLDQNESALTSHWQNSPTNLSEGICYAQSIVHQHYIFVVGGTWSNHCQHASINYRAISSGSSLIQIIDTRNNAVTVAFDQLLYATNAPSIAIIDDIFYVFGGVTTSVSCTWMYTAVAALYIKSDDNSELFSTTYVGDLSASTLDYNHKSSGSKRNDVVIVLSLAVTVCCACLLCIAICYGWGYSTPAKNKKIASTNQSQQPFLPALREDNVMEVEMIYISSNDKRKGYQKMTH